MTSFLFVHGWGFGPDFWQPLIEALGVDEPALIDLSYFSPSFPRKRESIRCTDWIPAFAGMTEGVIAVTHSYGTMWLLKHLPPMLDRLFIINGFPRFTETDDYRPAVPLRVEQRMIQRFDADPEATLRDFRARCGATEPLPPLEKARLAEDLQALAEDDARPEFRELKAPVLVLASHDDPIVRPDMTAQAFAGNEIAWAKTGGHLLPQTEPNWCADRIRDFTR